jgi:hypothetical protein
MNKVKEIINIIVNHIPHVLQGVVLIVLVGLFSYGFYAIISVALNYLSRLINYDLTGTVYFLMFTCNILLYVTFSKLLFKNRSVGKNTKWKCIAITEVSLIALQLLSLSEIPLLGFLATWIGGVGYLILFLYSFISLPYVLFFMASYLLGLLCPALFIYHFCKMGSDVH